MSRTLSQEEIAALMNGGSVQTTDASSGPPGVPSPGLRLPQASEVQAGSICLSDRPQMESGWLNTLEGIEWNIKRVAAFTKMSAGRMTFGSSKKERGSAKED